MHNIVLSLYCIHVHVVISDHVTCSRAQALSHVKMAHRRGQQDARAALQSYELQGVRETGEELGRGSYAAVIAVDYKGLRCAAKKIYDILAQRGALL